MKRKQLTLNLHRGSWGGRRPGSGRKRLHSPGVAHQVREKVNSKMPLHINLKVKVQIQNKACLKILKKAIINARGKGLLISHYSLQSNHLHFIVEATDNKTLTRGMRSLTVTFAKNIQRGRIQTERYHLHVLKTLREARNALHYVLFNEQKHRNLKTAYITPFSSLRFCKDLNVLAQKAKMRIVKTRMDHEDCFLDQASCWLLTKASTA